ncbi:MAG: hypothetical protein M0R80_31860 [Proteobacteria bacterium]|jgi:hypothetical protein|nr:hypothetical protein [Pseudomonadota bacterium]
MTAKIKARIWLDGRDEPVIADVMNPGGWFGQCHVVQVAIANALNPFFVIEAASPDEAINHWADSDKYGHHINDEEAQAESDAWWENYDGTPAFGDDRSMSEQPPEYTTAGNDSHCVNLDNVAFCKFDKIEYFVELDKDNYGEVSAIASAIEDEAEDE